jgi:hypothetical protein
MTKAERKARVVEGIAKMKKILAKLGHLYPELRDYFDEEVAILEDLNDDR